jgi:hypothetical protein
MRVAGLKAPRYINLENALVCVDNSREKCRAGQVRSDAG